MGYNLYITRAKEWSSNEGCQIGDNEWRSIVESDSSLAPDPVNGPSFALWSGHPEKVESWFDLSEGNIYTKNPDGPTIDKMMEIARVLEATVQGEEGEIYPLEKSPVRRPAAPGGILSHFTGFINGLKRSIAASGRPADVSALSFKQGDRVRCVLSGAGTVVKIHPNDQGGIIDTVTVKFDRGTTQKRAVNASGLELIDEQKNS
jgi:hypothetical protein